MRLCQRLAVLENQVVRSDLVERDPRPRHLDLLVRVRLRGWSMQETDRGQQVRERPIRQTAELGFDRAVECLGDPLAEPLRREALGHAVDRCQLWRGRSGFLAMQSVLRVRHLKAERAQPHVPETAHPQSRLEGVALTGVEVEEPHCQTSSGRAEGDDQRAAASVGDAGSDDLVGHQALPPRSQLIQRHGPRPVLVAERRMQDEITDRVDGQPCELLRVARANPRQTGHRGVEEGARASPHFSSEAAMIDEDLGPVRVLATEGVAVFYG